MLFFSSFSDFKIFQGLGNEELWRRLVSVIHTTTIFWGAAYLFRKSSATIASKVASEVEKGAFTYNSKIPAPLSLSRSLYLQNVQYVFARVSPSHSHRYRISFYMWKIPRRVSALHNPFWKIRTPRKTNICRETKIWILNFQARTLY